VNYRSIAERSDDVKTGELMLPWDKLGRNLFTGLVASGIEVA